MAAQGGRPPERGGRLFLGNLPYDANESHISLALPGCSGVRYVGIRRGPEAQTSRGHGQVEFSTDEGRNVRRDWSEQPLRRKAPGLTNQLGASGGAQRDVAVQGGIPTIELFGSDGCLTGSALAAAEGVTLGDLEQILDELRLLLPSTGSLLQQLLQESPLLRGALLQAQLLVGRHDNIDLSSVTAASLKRAEAAATQRLLLECRALRPPSLPALTITPAPQTSVKPLTSAASSRQKKQETKRLSSTWRQPAPPRGPSPADTLTGGSGPQAGASWRASPPPEPQVGEGPALGLSPLTPEPSASANNDRAEAKTEGGGLLTAVAPQKRKREGGEQQQTTKTAAGTFGGAKRTQMPQGASAAVGSSTDSHSEWLVAEEAKASPAANSLVDELLRSQGLLQKVIEMAPAEIMQLDQQHQQQILSLRKALRARGKLPPSGA